MGIKETMSLVERPLDIKSQRQGVENVLKRALRESNEGGDFRMYLFFAEVDLGELRLRHPEDSSDISVDFIRTLAMCKMSEKAVEVTRLWDDFEAAIALNTASEDLLKSNDAVIVRDLAKEAFDRVSSYGFLGNDIKSRSYMLIARAQIVQGEDPRDSISESLSYASVHSPVFHANMLIEAAGLPCESVDFGQYLSEAQEILDSQEADPEDLDGTFDLINVYDMLSEMQKKRGLLDASQITLEHSSRFDEKEALEMAMSRNRLQNLRKRLV